MIEHETIYLDFQSSTPVRPEVLAAMLPYFSELYGNPHSSNHIKGWESNRAVEISRQKIATSINSVKSEIVFTSGATEANNLVIRGLEKYLQSAKKSTIVVSSIEHKCVLESAVSLKEHGFNIIYVQPNSDGIVTKDALENVMNDDVGLVSIMLVNNEIGTIQPVKELSDVSHQHGALFHTDASQALVFMNIDVDELSVDFMSLSSHKSYGPKGIGALYISTGYKTALKPIIHGGGQEDGLRSGTLPTALCVGMGEAVALCASQAEMNSNKLKNISNEFWTQIKTTIPQVRLNGSHTARHPGNLNIYFPGIDSFHFLQILQPHIAASTGSACNSGIETPSYVLGEIGLDMKKAASSVRFSFGIYQTEEEIKKATDTICKVYKQHIATESAT